MNPHLKGDGKTSHSCGAKRGAWNFAAGTSGVCLNKAECIKEHRTLADAFTDTSADGVNVSAASSLMLASLQS